MFFGKQHRPCTPGFVVRELILAARPLGQCEVTLGPEAGQGLALVAKKYSN